MAEIIATDDRHMDAIRSLTRILDWRPLHDVDPEPERPDQAWLAWIERRLDEGDVLTPDEQILVRGYLDSLEQVA